ncbi:hypothetical protein KJ966_28470 [bacterium]|nr:hypothetical protein [bacterium]
MTPFYSFFRANFFLLSGQFSFPGRRVGEIIPQKSDEAFTIFRQMIKKRNPQKGKPGAIFKVRFQVINMSPEKNRIFSLFTIPFFTGLPGFCSKIWLENKNREGEFMGIYEWETVQDAENYSQSFAMRNMTKRSLPGSASFEITAQQ